MGIHHYPSELPFGQVYTGSHKSSLTKIIDKCSHLFYDWLNWEYIRDLFFVPKYNKNGVMKDEFNKYMANIEHYPFQMYIHWQPADVGSIVYSDRKFLKIIYGQHNDSFTDFTKYKDADDGNPK